ncbi:MAG: Ferric reductase domain protein transrane component, N-terminal domain [Gemmatimonadetes bacterium]|nr:Ferric reductase domain protein transrane component, N-terminal domain [Gemmatimonadota bacterium]
MDPKDLTSYLGLATVYLLSANVLLGLLMSARYNPWKRWPHKRINILKLHNWTAYIGLGLAVLHPIPLLFADKPHFGIGDILFPVSSPEQPFVNSLGAIALYLLAFTVITSIYRAEIGRQRWKPLHYLTYLVAALFIVHGSLSDQHLDNSPMDLLDAEKVGIMACGVVILAATIVRFRWTAKHPKFQPRRQSDVSA